MIIIRWDRDLQTPVVRFHIMLPFFKHRSPVFWLLVGCLLFTLVACSGQTSRTSVPPTATVHTVVHSTPTATPLPAGTVLYQAEWSHGLESWQGTHGWRVVQGQLETDTSNSTTLLIPYRPQVANYALEMRIQIVRLLQTKGGASFTIFASKASGKDGYKAGPANLLASVTQPFGSHPQVQVFIDPFSDTASSGGLPTAYYVDSQWHTYRVEVQGNAVRLLEDNTQVSYASSTHTNVLSNGPLGLSSELVVLRVSSIRITAL